MGYKVKLYLYGGRYVDEALSFIRRYNTFSMTLHSIPQNESSRTRFT